MIAYRKWISFVGVYKFFIMIEFVPMIGSYDGTIFVIVYTIIYN